MSFKSKYRDLRNIIFNVLSLGIPNVANGILKKKTLAKSRSEKRREYNL